MLAVGMIEIAAGLLVAFRPRIGAYVVARLALGHYRQPLADTGVFRYRPRRFRIIGRAHLASARLSCEFNAKPLGF